MLMGAWNEIKLGDLFNIKAGGDLQESSFSKTYSELTPYPVFSNSLINKGLFGFTSAPRYSRNCITITGRGDLGHAEYRDIEFDAIVRLLVLSPKTDVDCVFVTYYINGILKFSIESTGVPQLPAPRVTKKKILIPESIQEQTAIASILSKVDEAILATQNSIKAAEKLKKALMQNLLTGKLKPDGTWRTDDEFYMDEKFGKVPNGWEVKPVGDKSICNINPNYKYIKGRLYDFIPMDGINDSFRGVGYSELQKIDGGGYTRFKLGDILFAKITPCTENGKVALIEKMKTEVGFASTEFIIFQVKETTDNLFFYYLLSSDKVHKLAVSLMEGTTGRQRVPWKVFKNRISVPIPNDISEQKAIASKLKCIELSNIDKQNKIETLQRLKKSLMQNLLTGKVRVDVEKINELINQ